MIALQIILITIIFLVILWQACLIYASFFGAPSVNSSRRAIKDVLDLVKPQKGTLLIDLGCASGWMLITAAKECGCRGIGFERSPWYFLWARLNIFLHGEGKRVKIFFGDFKRAERHLKEADFVYIYLLNSVLAKMEDWLFEAIGPETKVISLAFTFPHHQPTSEIETRNLGVSSKARIYSK